MLCKLAPGGFGVAILSVSDAVPVIGCANRLDNVRMNAGIVIAGETANWFHLPSNVTDGARGAVVRPPEGYSAKGRSLYTFWLLIRLNCNHRQSRSGPVGSL